MKKLDGKLAIITGGAAGMGAEHALFIQHDVSKEEDWEKVVKQAEKKFGPIHILVNNAGISPILSLESSLDEYLNVVKINQVSVFLGMKYVLPSMKKVKTASIINISSINGLQAGALGYTDTKFAVRGMTKAAAKQLAPHNIRVNSVHPGAINTPMVRESANSEKIEAIAQTIPLGRMAEPNEVSQLVLFLASDDSSYSTGSEFIVDGGITA